ncbi:hypothetical protein ACH4LE_01540 [Streptomyces sp. NPDC017413]|uniref:hypothetical protein n=1 Tax=Streptomyces sp. NPDC017413 TaxID=3364994 RepID=UPI00379BF579
MAHRCRCGECRFATRWTTESEVGDLAAAHYAENHPGPALGGIVEINQKNPDSLGFLQMLGIALLLLVIVATCRR